MKPIAVDLFSGCGGLTLGLKQAGFRVVGAVEIDPLAVETYQANHKSVQVWKQDIRNVTATAMVRRLKLRRGQLDLLAGCPPCQGFSTLTTLNGHSDQDDPRNDLVLQFLRFVRALRPKAIMMENVPGLAKDKRLQKFVSALDAMGYRCSHSVLDAAKYGVPQRRRRFILLAGYRQPISFGKPSAEIRTVRQALKGLERKIKRDALHTLPQKRSAKVKRLIASIPKNGGSRLDLGADLQLACHQSCDGFKDVYGRMAWDDVAPTITGGCFNPSKGRFLHPARNRAISLREAAVLQSFPATYSFSIKKGKCATAQMIGNALPPEFIKRHAENIVDFVRCFTSRKSKRGVRHGQRQRRFAQQAHSEAVTSC